MKTRTFAILAVSLLVSLAFTPLSASLAGSTESRDARDLAVEAKPPKENAVGGSTQSLWRLYVYGAGILVARIGADGTRFFHPDTLGSTRLVTDASGTPVFSAVYEPFGAVAVECEGQSCPFSPRQRFAGEWRDEPVSGETYHLYAREYDPVLGRFLSEDPVLGSLSAPQTQNRYAYVANNPLTYTDPTGECIWDLCIGEALLALGILAVAGIAVGVAANYVPELRPVADLFATVFGFIPLYGDIYSTAYFLTRDAFECQSGGCDWGAIGLDLLGGIPGVPNAGGGAHALKAIGAAGSFGVVLRTTNRLEGGFDSFRALKNALGSPGSGRVFHHLVEQRNILRAGLGKRLIHNINNVVSVTHGWAGSVHDLVGRFYSSIHRFTGGKTFRTFLNGKSYEEQLDWGWWALEQIEKGRWRP